MEYTDLLIGGAVGLATSISLIMLILRASQNPHFISRASEQHHTHKTPVPRLGGVAFAGAMLVAFALFSSLPGRNFLLIHERWLVVPCSLAMFGLGLWDDLSALGARRKLFGQIAIATAAYLGGIGIFHFRMPFTDRIIDLGQWSWLITVFWLVAMTNLINLIDGIDGLAGGICLMLMVLLMYVSLHNGVLPTLSASMIGALLGFLWFNFPPARIYMGDGGAYFLGFYIGCMTIVTSQKGTIFAAMVAPLFVLALPIIDTSLAILRRGMRGLPLFRPDRKHIHHRLLDLGHSSRTVVLGLYAFTAFFLLLGFASYCWQGRFFPLFFGVGVLTIILAAGKFDFSREWFSIGRLWGNSQETRSEIQYAMSLSRWLALEGTRVATIEELDEDVVFIARKLGFTKVKICLKAEEKVWALMPNDTERCHTYTHELPGHRQCFLELSIGCPESKKIPANNTCIKCRCATDIYADLLAEGWIKAVRDWQKCHRILASFDPPLKVPAAATATAAVSQKHKQP